MVRKTFATEFAAREAAEELIKQVREDKKKWQFFKDAYEIEQKDKNTFRYDVYATNDFHPNRKTKIGEFAFEKGGEIERFYFNLGSAESEARKAAAVLMNGNPVIGLCSCNCDYNIEPAVIAFSTTLEKIFGEDNLSYKTIGLCWGYVNDVLFTLNTEEFKNEGIRRENNYTAMKEVHRGKIAELANKVDPCNNNCVDLSSVAKKSTTGDDIIFGTDYPSKTFELLERTGCSNEDRKTNFFVTRKAVRNNDCYEDSHHCKYVYWNIKECLMNEYEEIERALKGTHQMVHKSFSL